jgi:hypothetical protein
VFGCGDLGFGRLGLVSAADDAEDHQRCGGGDPHERQVRGWSGVGCKELGCDYLAAHGSPFVWAALGAGEGEPS